jgi:hypothetical protein
MFTPISSHARWRAAISAAVSITVRPKVSVSDSVSRRTCGTRSATAGYLCA